MITSTSTTKRIGALLIGHGYVTPEQLEQALQQQQQTANTKLLGEVLVELEFCSEDQVMECLAEEFGVPYAKLEQRMYDPSVVDVLSRRVYAVMRVVRPSTLTRLLPENCQ